MSLAAVAGKVSSIKSGVNNIGKSTYQNLYDNSDFLRNSESSYGQLVGAIDTVMDSLTDLGNALGVKNNMYIIGKYEETTDRNMVERAVGLVAQPLLRAVSYWFDKDAQNGVIIDGFDNFKGDISVALPENPVVYGTSVVDQVVRNPNRLSMRVYVDLMHSDDIVQNIKQMVADSFGGLTGMIMNAVTDTTMNRAQKALSGLQWIQEYGKPFRVYTPHKVYDNMMIEKISPVNDKKMNEILAADIVFKEVILTQALGTVNKSAARMVPEKSMSMVARTWGFTTGGQ